MWHADLHDPGRRAAEFRRTPRGNIVNPLLDVGKYLPHSAYAENYGNRDDQPEMDLYNGMLREADLPKQRTLMCEFEKHLLDVQAHEGFLLWRYRIVSCRGYVKGWKISPSHYLNQDLATIWLDK